MVVADDDDDDPSIRPTTILAQYHYYGDFDCCWINSWHVEFVVIPHHHHHHHHYNTASGLDERIAIATIVIRHWVKSDIPGNPSIDTLQAVILS